MGPLSFLLCLLGGYVWRGVYIPSILYTRISIAPFTVSICLPLPLLTLPQYNPPFSTSIRTIYVAFQYHPLQAYTIFLVVASPPHRTLQSNEPVESARFHPSPPLLLNHRSLRSRSLTFRAFARGAFPGKLLFLLFFITPHSFPPLSLSLSLFLFLSFSLYYHPRLASAFYIPRQYSASRPCFCETSFPLREGKATKKKEREKDRRRAVRWINSRFVEGLSPRFLFPFLSFTSSRISKVAREFSTPCDSLSIRSRVFLLPCESFFCAPLPPKNSRLDSESYRTFVYLNFRIFFCYSRTRGFVLKYSFTSRGRATKSVKKFCGTIVKRRRKERARERERERAFTNDSAYWKIRDRWNVRDRVIDEQGLYLCFVIFLH